MCELCGSDDGCKPIDKRLGFVKELNAQDWKEIYEHMRYAHLPFLHSVILRARQRKEIEKHSRHASKHIDILDFV